MRGQAFPSPPWERVGVREIKRLEQAWGRILQRWEPGRKKRGAYMQEGGDVQTGQGQRTGFPLPRE